MKERKNVLRVKDNDLTLLGEELTEGSQALPYKVVDKNLKEIESTKYENKIKVICSVPSLDTPICQSEIKRFNDEAAELSKEVVIVFISMDLPFAQTRFCKENDIKKVKTYSDHKDADFGAKYGVLIKENRLLARAVFIVDKQQIVQYVQYVSDLGHAPDYESALKKLKELI